MGRIVDRTGQRYGRLTVLQHAGTHKTPNGNKFSVWLCRCDCGSLTRARGNSLGNGHTRSCGCLQRYTTAKLSVTHGLSDSPEYKIWLGVMKRCYNPSSSVYAWYGGKGVTVCERWHDFTKFLEDMGTRPAKHSIDRIDSTGNYEPGNCRWASTNQQARNTSRNVWVTYNGERMVLTDAAKLAGLSWQTVSSRRRRGWPESRWLEPISRRGANLFG